MSAYNSVCVSNIVWQCKFGSTGQLEHVWPMFPRRVPLFFDVLNLTFAARIDGGRTTFQLANIAGRFICMTLNWRIYANSNCSLAEREINLAQHVSQFTVQRSKRLSRPELISNCIYTIYVRLIIELYSAANCLAMNAR